LDLNGSTIGREEITVIDGDAEDVLLEVFDAELHGGVPFGVQRVGDDLRLVFLSTHADFTVWVTLAYIERGAGYVEHFSTKLIISYLKISIKILLNSL
jgi:hypothetical protein